MKRNVLLGFTISLCLLSACAGPASQDGTSAPLTGTYIRAAQHEFGKEYDTLVVTLRNEASSQYRIVRNWLYERIRDGQALEPEYKTTSGTAIYDHDAKTLKDEKTGIIYSVDPSGQKLYAGSTRYDKLK